MKQTNFLFIIALIAVFVAFANIFVTFDKIKSLTGYVASTGWMNLSVDATTSVNFSTASINWSTGAVTPGQVNATLYTAGGVISGGNWTANSAGLVLINIGNTNVSLVFGVGKSATSFIGGSSSGYYWNFSNIEAGSCTNGTDHGQGTLWNTNTSATICSTFDANDNLDSMRIDIEVVIPNNAAAGSKGDVLTATATAI